MARNSDEREAFSRRLRQALTDARHSAGSPTELARDFNIRYAGPPVTVHAARKWLVGEAIPTQDKMRALADWLMVPIDWLRFGDDAQRSRIGEENISADDLKLLADLHLLAEREQVVVRELIRLLVRMYFDQQSRDHAPHVRDEHSFPQEQ